jgi:hypothetical protein
MPTRAHTCTRTHTHAHTHTHKHTLHMPAGEVRVRAHAVHYSQRVRIENEGEKLDESKEAAGMSTAEMFTAYMVRIVHILHVRSRRTPGRELRPRLPV